MSFLRPLLLAADPALDVVIWPDPRCREARVAICWDSPPGAYAQMPELALVQGVAAGVDNIISDQDMAGLRVCRVVDPELTRGMLEYVMWSVLYFHRRFDEALSNQRSQTWRSMTQIPAAEFRVGIMGLGVLGGRVAANMASAGYAVSAWTRTPRDCAHARVFSGSDGLRAFLSDVDVLVCLLPLTVATRSILDRSLLAKLPTGAALVHCGRGDHLVPSDLIAALGSGQLRGAILDVFSREPLPADDPLWHTPGVVVTPHIASSTSRTVMVRQVIDNLRNFREGRALHNEVDLTRGY